ncbi:C40 family peptidase [Carboxylicivirga linearis]|uniref:C40 family peptidase n=1 Tax=Carboxylicivirga linearis TaxID=1628157 RepID=A0ABS5JWE4_9BACT|nr:C40 family peptidase [Carboxylicivirga linearis]MBS2099235.1 C40 family peptidase [Carboxylicivirga linearis]
MKVYHFATLQFCLCLLFFSFSSYASEKSTTEVVLTGVKKEIRQLRKEINRLEKELSKIKSVEQKLADEEELLKKKAWAEAGKRKKRRNKTKIRNREQKLLSKLTAKRSELSDVRTNIKDKQTEINKINNRIAYLSGETMVVYNKSGNSTRTAPIPETKPSSLKKEARNWLGTRYRYGGTSKSGVDCSGLSGQIYRQVYNITLPRTSADQYRQAKKVSKSGLKPGDLVFFKINSGRVSHVGIYLGNDEFIHASTKRGVVISSLNETYYKRYFAGGGRY